MEIIQDLKPVEQVVWDFYGTPLKAMRRTQLWRLCDIHKIEYPRGCIKDILLSILENRETMLQANGGTLLSPPPGMTEETFWKLINGPRKEYNDYTGGMAEGQTNVEQMQGILEGRSHFEVEGVSNEEFVAEANRPIDPHDPKSMSMPELRKAVKASGHKQKVGMTRVQLEGLLNG